MLKDWDRPTSPNWMFLLDKPRHLFIKSEFKLQANICSMLAM